MLTNNNPQGFYFDQRACVGCRTCQIACKDKNDLKVGMLFRNVTSYETGSFPEAKIYHYSATCNNCAQPACVAICPTGAMHIDEEDGTTQHDDEHCIGCKQCMSACPYGVPQFDEEQSITRKCDSCIQLRAQGEQPACVASCPMRALEFGPISDLKSSHPDAVDAIAILPDPATTTPSVLVAAREAATVDAPTQVIL